MCCRVCINPALLTRQSFEEVQVPDTAAAYDESPPWDVKEAENPDIHIVYHCSPIVNPLTFDLHRFL